LALRGTLKPIDCFNAKSDDKLHDFEISGNIFWAKLILFFQNLHKFLIIFEGIHQFL
jgi:hypothetical protein